MTRYQIAAALAAASAVAGCQSVGTTLPKGQAAYDIIPPAPAVAPDAVVRNLTAGDAIAINVFREPELSVPRLIVDELGNVQLPLIGQVRAEGQSPSELSSMVEQRLGTRYLRNPKVAVWVVEPVERSFTVEGQVVAPGIFKIRPNETLLSAMAQARSPSPSAKLDEVIVFRKVNGQRMGGVFDLEEVRTGRVPDPQILHGDTVVVGYSQVKGAFRDFLQAAPLINLFTVF